jgi:hypothetical protein
VFLETLHRGWLQPRYDWVTPAAVRGTWTTTSRTNMTNRLLAPILAVALLASGAALPGRTTTMGVEELKPGMVGTGVTVFEGERREEFQVHILGVLENVIGPKRQLILARLEGGPLADTGVIAGMSGSPVYVDGRLIGAVSYSLGSFSKEPIAGITPIDEMIDATAPPGGVRLPVRPVDVPLPLTQDGVLALLAQGMPRALPFADSAGSRTVSGADLDRFGVSLRPIATPLSMAGFSDAARHWLAEAFAGAGFVPVTAGGGSMPPGPEDAAPLQPGDPVGVSLVGGDLALGATGTVTHVDGRRVYAFGHPFFNLGPTAFPMTRAHVHTVIPSLLSSVKLASTGAVIGTVQQDRATAIAGTLGEAPPLVPVTIALESERGPTRRFNLRIANDQMFTPVLTFASIMSVLQSYEREFGMATFTVTGETRVKGYGKVALEDIFTGDSSSMSAAAYVVTPITLLLRNTLSPVDIEGVDLTIRSTEQPRTATLERVWIDRPTVKPGQTVDLKVLTRSYRGEETLRTIPITVPANAKGSLSVLVSDGTRLAQWEQREWRQALQAQSINQMIRVFNNVRKNNRLYVRLIANELGAVVDGEPLPALPPSVLAVLEADRSSGRVSTTRSSTLGQWDVPTDAAVVGSRMLTLTVGSE